MPTTTTTRFVAPNCQLSISEPYAERLLIALEGRDLGQLGCAPFQELERRVGARPGLHLCFDLRRATGATLEASGSWAIWLRKNRARLSKVHMLTAHPMITLSAKAVQRFADLGAVAHIRAGAAPLEYW